jgi:hypothetical protein
MRKQRKKKKNTVDVFHERRRRRRGDSFPLQGFGFREKRVVVVVCWRCCKIAHEFFRQNLLL